MSTSIRLHNSKPRPGSRHRVKRLGCGESSGHGKTSGKGHKGQKARSGGSIRLGFEGGQMPLIRRIPKRGFNNASFKITYAPVNLADIELLFDAGSVDEKSLREKGLVNGKWDGVKILGGGDVTKKFAIKVNAISASAKEKLEKAGGSIELLAAKVHPARNSAKVLAKTAKPAKAPGQALDSRQEGLGLFPAMHTGSRAFCILMALAATGTEVASAAGAPAPGHYRVEAKLISVTPESLNHVSDGAAMGLFSNDMVCAVGPVAPRQHPLMALL